MGALLIFPQGNPPPPIFRRAPRYLRRGLGQEGSEDGFFYDDYSWSDGGSADFYGNGYSDFDVWLYEQGYEDPTQYYADVEAGYWDEPAFDSGGQYVGTDPSLLYADEPSAPWDVPEFVPLTEEIVPPEEGFYGEAINHLADIGILGAEEAAAVINGELDLQEALNISGYYGDYSAGLIPAVAQQAVADAQAKQDAAKKAQPAAGGSSGGGSAGGGTPAQKAAQAQAAAAKTPAEIAAAQKAMAEANAAAGSWLEKDSLIGGVKNLYLLAGGAAAFLLLKGGGGGPAVSYTTVSPPAAPRAPRKTNPHRRHRRQRAHRRRR